MSPPPLMPNQPRPPVRAPLAPGMPPAAPLPPPVPQPVPQPQRLPGWPHRLAALVTLRLGVPFTWGSNDCAAWVADAVAALHGRDTLHELRGKRRTALQAKRQLRRVGGYAAVMARAGLQAVPPALAQHGDVVLLRHDGPQPLLGLCIGADALAPAAGGLRNQPMAMALQAWRA